MKKLFLTLLLLTISVKFITAQDLKSVLLDPYYPIDFIGLDFSNSKLIGYQGDYEPAYDVVIRFIPEWNDMFYTQQEKFDVARFLKKYVVHYSTENMISVNDKIDPSELITNSRLEVQQFTSIQLEKMVENYDFEFKNDVALVFIINSLNKKEKQNKLHAVFFNANSREILLSTPLVTGPEGFGFRNYWIGSIHNVLKVLGKNEYKKWKKLYKK